MINDLVVVVVVVVADVYPLVIRTDVIMIATITANNRTTSGCTTVRKDIHTATK